MNSQTGEIQSFTNEQIASGEAQRKGFDVVLTMAEAEILEDLPDWARRDAMQNWADKLASMKKPNRALLIQRKQDFLEGFVVGFHYGRKGEFL